MEHTGKVIFQDGTAPRAGIQIVIWTTTEPPATVAAATFPAPFVPAYDAVTDAAGEFSFDIPDGQNAGLTQARVSIMGSNTDPAPVALIADALPLRLIVITAAFDLPVAPAPDVSATPIAPQNAKDDPCRFNLRGFDVQSQQRYLHLARVGNHEGNPPKVQRYTILATQSLSAEDIQKIKDTIAERGSPFAPKIYGGPIAAAQEKSKALEKTGARDLEILEAQAVVDFDALLQSAAVGVSPTLEISKTKALKNFNLATQHILLQASQIAFPDWWRRPARYALDCDQALDWDYTPTIVQACEPYFYHVLEYVQEVVHAGYQEGPIVGSSTLLPCQEKRITTLTNRNMQQDSLTEQQEQREGLRTSVTRALDMQDLQRATMREASSGSSSSSIKSIGAMAGAVLGPVVLGVAGGASKASSVATQNSSRAISRMASKNLRDSVQRAAESIRSSTATLVRTSTEQEENQASTEVIKNHSPTRTLDLVTHEIYSAFDVGERLVDVHEAIAVPFRVSLFDDEKALRWRHALVAALPDRQMARGFEAIEHILTDYAGAHVPPDRFADAEIRFIEGTLELECRIQRPPSTPPDWTAFSSYLGTLNQFHFLRLPIFDKLLKRWYENEERSAAYYTQNIAPKLANELVQYIQVSMVDRDDTETLLPLDPTPLTRLDADGRFTVSFNASTPPDAAVTRANLKYLKFQLISPDNQPVDIEDFLPEGSTLIVHSGAFGYLSDYDSAPLFRNTRIRDDLSGSDVALVPTPLSRRELVSPVDEDIKLRNTLLQELNSNLVVYHEAIYNHLAYNNPSHLRMLLDSLFLPGSGNQISVRDVIGSYIGAFDGCVVFYVGAGHDLTSQLFADPDTGIAPPLMTLYAPASAPEPLRVTTPTGTTFTKTYLGQCTLREKIDETLAVDWANPCGTTEISMPQLSSRLDLLSAPTFTNFSKTDFKEYLTALDIPEGSALSEALLTAVSGSFADITGLELNQKNAMAAFDASLSAAGTAHNAAQARYLADQNTAQKRYEASAALRLFDAASKRLDEAVANGQIDEETAKELRGKLFGGLIDGMTPKEPEPAKPATGTTPTGTANDVSVNPQAG